jgi:hypothetical protein
VTDSKDRLRRWIRIEDAAWLALFLGLGLASPTRNDAELELLAGLAAFQVLEPRVALFRNPRGVVASVLIKLGLVYLLMGVSGGVTSTYYLLLVMPVITAATSMGAAGTVAVCR